MKRAIHKRGLFLLLALVFASSTISLSASADEKSEAIEHFHTGLSLLKAENYQGAVVEFETSVGLYESKNALFNLANCYQALHRYQEALDTFDRLENAFGDSLGDDMREAVARHRQDIDAVVGEIKVEVSLEDASVRLNGVEIGKSPIDKPLVLGPGEYSVEVSKQGFETTKREITLAAKQARTVVIELKPAPAELVIESGVSGATVTVDGEIVGTTPLKGQLRLEGGEHLVEVTKQGYQQFERRVSLTSGERLNLEVALASTADDTLPQEEPSKRGKPSKLFWTGVGLTAAAAVTTGVFWGMAGSAANDFENYDDKISQAFDDDENADSWESKRDEAEDDCNLYSNLTIGFGIGAGAFAIASGIILIFDLKDKESDVELSAAPGGVVLNF